MKPRILYIDDEPDNLNAFANVFRRVYSIHISDSAKKGLDYLKNNEVDLIITDQLMPEMSGTEFLKIIKEVMPDEPPCRMIYSGYSKTDEIDEAKNQNLFSTFVSKPCDPDDLKTHIDYLINECE